MLAHIGHDLLREIGASVVHGQEDARHGQTGVEVLLDQLDVAQQLTQTLEGVILALDRDQDFSCSDEGIDRQEPERRRAVDEDVVVALTGRLGPLEVRLQCRPEPLLPGDERHELDLGAGEVDGRRDAEQRLELGALLDDVVHVPVVDDDVVDAGSVSAVVDTQGGGGVSLGIEVDHQDTGPAPGECCRQVDGRRRLADAALLVGHGEDPCLGGRGRGARDSAAFRRLRSASSRARGVVPS
nr:hypothetical protein GCM10025699_70930 [Microbacterium flavescens]